MAHTWTSSTLPGPRAEQDTNPATPDVTTRFTDHVVTATAATDRAVDILTQHGFTPPRPQQNPRPESLSEPAPLSAVIPAETHLHTDGILAHIDLGIAAVQDIPPACRLSAPAPPSTGQVRRRSR
jgi:hypothetical protein